MLSTSPDRYYGPCRLGKDFKVLSDFRGIQQRIDIIFICYSCQSNVWSIFDQLEAPHRIILTLTNARRAVRHPSGRDL